MRGRSLRFRIILVGVLPLIVAAAVVALLAPRAFNDYGVRRDRQLMQTLHVQSQSLAALLLGAGAGAASKKGDDPPRLSSELRRATGSKIYFLEHNGFLKARPTGLPALTGVTPDWDRIDRGETVVLRDVRVPGDDAQQLAVVTGIFRPTT